MVAFSVEDERTGGGAPKGGESGGDRSRAGRTRRPDPEEREWIRRCRNGSRSAYEPLVRRYARFAEAYAFRRVRNREDARDLAQEAFVRAFHAMPRFRPGRPFLPWFLTILDNLCRSHRRRFREESGIDEVPLPPTDGGMETLDRRLDLERGLAQLPQTQREVVVLKEIRGFAHREVAERLEIPVGTAMSRLHTALRRLRRLLGGPAGGSGGSAAGAVRRRPRRVRSTDGKLGVGGGSA